MALQSSRPNGAPLVGRAAALERLERLIAALGARRGGALVIEGPAGIGKTRLLHAAAEMAPGFTVLAAAGVQSEAELPYASLHELVRPVLPLAGRLADRQARALAAALALEEQRADTAFAASAALVSLLGEAARERPVLVLLDDAQWLDSASAGSVAFAVRRLGDERVGMLVAVKDGELPPALRDPRMEHLRLGPLDAADAVALARAVAGESRHGVARIVELAAGNPLAIVELATAAREGLSFDALQPDGELVTRLFGLRVARLSATATTAVVATALHDADDAGPVVAAATALGATEGDWEEAERADVLRLSTGQVRFAHPLLRAAALGRAAPGLRRRVHLALAEALAARGEAGRAAWHRAGAAVAPDEAVAAALEVAAGEYRRRAGHGAAAAALEQAARLSPRPSERARRFLAAGESAHRGGDIGWAQRLAQAALTAAPDGSSADWARLLVAHADAWRGSCDGALRGYARVATEAREPALAAVADGYAAAIAIVAGKTDAALAAARRAHALRELPEPARIAARESLGGVLALRGDTEEARTHLEAVAGWYERQADRAGAEYVAEALMWMGEYPRVHTLLDDVVSGSRRSGDVSRLVQGLALRAELGYRTGAWTTAHADAAEAASLARDAGQSVALAYSLAALALQDAAAGRPGEARAAAAEAVALARRHGLMMVEESSGFALGLLALGAGEVDAAVRHLEATAALVEPTGRGEPAVCLWAADRIEALLLSGRGGDAAGALESLRAQAERTSGAWAKGAVARCEGLSVADDRVDATFAVALHWHRRAAMPFELARTELCHGSRLRRMGRRIAAREQLGAALRTFERLPAPAWAERARRELAGTGERLRRGPSADRDALTDQELQVARCVAAGATNKEAAADLFLSPKTIETHLSRIYRKLGVRSRSELAGTLNARP